jgi:hypothetical protein
MYHLILIVRVMLEAVKTSETSVNIYWTTRRSIPDIIPVAVRTSNFTTSLI